MALARAVAIRLIGYRADRGLIQAQLAKVLGVKQPQVARLELGVHNPTWG
ncbi:MAG: helix-turn-helix transcriptional regulator [Chloroflexota bacterium]